MGNPGVSRALDGCRAFSSGTVCVCVCVCVCGGGGVPVNVNACLFFHKYNTNHYAAIKYGCNKDE